MTGLARREAPSLALTDEQVELVKRTVAQGATNDELAMFLYQASRTGLDPLARQIHFVVRTSNGQRKGSIQTGIDGYRLIADRTGKYAGNDDPVYEGATPEGYPAKATVTVWKIVGGQRCPFTASARWSEYFPGDRLGFMWKKMPGLMLGKAAEALALRKAFPAELSGLYVDEEMHQVDGAIETTVAPKDSSGVGQTAVTGTATGSGGDPVRSNDRESGEGASHSGTSSPEDPPLPGDRPCPECGYEVNELRSSNERAPKWKCSNESCTGHHNKKSDKHEPWVSWSTNPWKPGGEVEQAIQASSSETGSTAAAAETQAANTEPTASAAPSRSSVEGGGNRSDTQEVEPNGTAPSDRQEPSPGAESSTRDGSHLFSILEQAWEGGLVTLGQAIRAAMGPCGRAGIDHPPSTKREFGDLPDSVLADIVEDLKLEQRLPV